MDKTYDVLDATTRVRLCLDWVILAKQMCDYVITLLVCDLFTFGFTRALAFVFSLSPSTVNSGQV